MSKNKKYVRRVSEKQMDILLEFVKCHTKLAFAYNYTVEERKYSDQKWNEVANLLNADSDGPQKDGKAWKKYWINYKAKLKTRQQLRSYLHWRENASLTKYLKTETEEKFLSILGPNFGLELPDDSVDHSAEPPKSDADMQQENLQYSESVPVVDSIPPVILYPPEPPLAYPFEIPITSSSQPLPPSPVVAQSPQLQAFSPLPATLEIYPLSEEALRGALTVDSQQATQYVIHKMADVVVSLHSMHTNRIERIIEAVFPRTAYQGNNS